MRARDMQETLTKRTALKPSTDFSFPFARRARLRFRDDDDERTALSFFLNSFASRVQLSHAEGSSEEVSMMNAARVKRQCVCEREEGRDS